MRKQIAIIALALVSLASANLADAALFGRRPSHSAADCVCVLPKTIYQSPYAPRQVPLVAAKTVAPSISQNDLLALQDTLNDLNRQVEAINQQKPKSVKVIPVSHPSTPKMVESLKGTAHLHNTAEDVYLVLLLPKNYQSCYPCAKLKSELENPSDASMREIRKSTRYKYYVEGDALYTQQKWGAHNPEVAQGKTVVLAVQGNRVILKYVSPDSSSIGSKLIEKLRDKFCPKICPNCPEPQPEPTPEPDEEVIPPTPEPPIPPTPEDESNPLAVAVVAGAVGFAAWLVMFKRGV